MSSVLRLNKLGWWYELRIFDVVSLTVGE